MVLEDGQVCEAVGNFCYLGDMLWTEGGADSAVTARICKGWRKFKELTPILGVMGIPLQLTGRLYTTCVQIVMMYGGKTWAPIKKLGERPGQGSGEDD